MRCWGGAGGFAWLHYCFLFFLTLPTYWAWNKKKGYSKWIWARSVRWHSVCLPVWSHGTLILPPVGPTCVFSIIDEHCASLAKRSVTPAACENTQLSQAVDPPIHCNAEHHHLLRNTLKAKAKKSIPDYNTQKSLLCCGDLSYSQFARHGTRRTPTRDSSPLPTSIANKWYILFGTSFVLP